MSFYGNLLRISFCSSKSRYFIPHNLYRENKIQLLNRVNIVDDFFADMLWMFYYSVNVLSNLNNIFLRFYHVHNVYVTKIAT